MNVEEKFEEADEAYNNYSYEKAFSLYKELSNVGYEQCYTLLGWFYLTGKGTNKSYIEAEKWLSLASESGNLEGKFYLAKLYWQQNKPGKVLALLDHCINDNYIPAIYRLAEFYEGGIIVDVDLDKAADLYERSMKYGHIFGENRYGRFLIRGRKGLSNIPRGFFYYVRSLFKLLSTASRDPHADSLKT